MRTLFVFYTSSGGDDAKVKLWDTTSGFCFVTFSAHTAAITGAVFAQSGLAVVTSSLDGTVRAFDTTRYRNFRTFTAPNPAQFSCLAIDKSGELVCAGAQVLTPLTPPSPRYYNPPLPSTPIPLPRYSNPPLPGTLTPLSQVLKPPSPRYSNPL